MKDESVKDIYEEYKKEFKSKHPFKRPLSFKKFNDMVEDKVKTDIHRGIKCYQFQILCHHSSNGQSPFTSLVLNLREAEDAQERKDLALLIENMLDRRIKGVTGSHGESVTPLFPKLLYWTCDGLNAKPGDPYYYLTKKAAKCITIRMAPDINSEKMSREIKSGQIIPSMGAARGDETVSIKIDDIEYNNIPIAAAYIKLRDSNKANHNFKIKTDITKYWDVVGVYKITYIPTGKYYIGSSKNVGRRLNEHNVSITHKGSLGDNYYIGDFDKNNYKEELLEECSINDLLSTEFKYIGLADKDCVNKKDPRKNGNFNSVNCKLAMKSQKYSTYDNKAYTWAKEVDGTRCFIKRKGEWTPIRKITYNDPNNCNLKLFEISYEKNRGVKKLYITEDHPLLTQKGRTKAIDIEKNDIIYDASSFEEYKVLDKKEVDNNVPTYDFEVDNDMFDLSGILSYNCRSWLSPLWIEKTYPLDTKFHWQEVDTSNLQYDGAPGKNFNYSRGFGEYSSIPEDIAKGVVINFRGNSGWVKSIDKENSTITIIQPRVYGRWNNGVVTINIPQYAGEAREKVNKLLSNENDITSFIDLPGESIDEFSQD